MKVKALPYYQLQVLSGFQTFAYSQCSIHSFGWFPGVCIKYSDYFTRSWLFW